LTIEVDYNSGLLRRPPGSRLAGPVHLRWLSDPADRRHGAVAHQQRTTPRVALSLILTVGDADRRLRLHFKW